MSYDPNQIEPKWRKFWADNKTFYCDTHDFSKPKYYVLDMFPFPSAQGLHVGHPEGYTATDIVARMKRMQGYNVLHPMGWDAFGLPAEQFAIKNNVHPEEFTRKNIDNFRNQIQMLGMSYDWDKEIATIDPDYYKWTQWIFVKMFEHDLAYVADIPVNFCPELGTVLANEEVINGFSERGHFPVIRMPMRQWILKITAYADRLEKDLDGLNWPKGTLDMQRNWIGRSSGVQITFKMEKSDDTFDVFTTRVDTLHGCTYCCLAPEHPLVKKLVTPAQKEAVAAYIKATQAKSDMDRTTLEKEKTGVYLGVNAINPIDGRIIPVYVADYVLGSYGTGAVMAVPAHDERDYAFAKKHSLPMIQVLEGDISTEAMVGDGKHINSKEANGLNIAEAKAAIAKILEEKGVGKVVINYKLRDWTFSRQRYWGEPIPTFQTEDGTEHALSEDELPLVLPIMEDYRPSKDGKPPLSRAPKDWLNFEYDGQKAQRETNTMPQWAGSSWYYLRYIDPKNPNAIGDPELLKHWLPVDLYIGGQEHAVLHLLYARFWHKFLKDIGVVDCDEPFARLYHQGMILGEDNEKMSKSRGNVVNPDAVVKEYGADSLRLFEMFAGPLADAKPWNTTGINGARRFIERVYRLVDEEENVKKIVDDDNGSLKYSYNQLVKKCSEDYEALAFNTAISQMMVFVNDCYKAKEIYRPYLENFIKMFSCVCPFVGEEIWRKLGHNDSIAYSEWPKYDPSALVLPTIKLAVAVNGKTRSIIEVDSSASEDQIKEKALKDEKIASFIGNSPIKKTIVVKGRMINFVI